LKSEPFVEDRPTELAGKGTRPFIVRFRVQHPEDPRHEARDGGRFEDNRVPARWQFSKFDTAFGLADGGERAFLDLQMIERAVGRGAPSGRFASLHRETESRICPFFKGKKPVVGGDPDGRTRRGDNAGRLKIFDPALADRLIRVLESSRRSRRDRLRPSRRSMRKGPTLWRRKVLRILRREFRDTFGPGHDVMKRSGREVCRARGPASAIEGNGDRQGPPPRVDVLDNLAVGESRGSALLVMERDNRVVAGRAVHHEISKKPKFFPTGHFRPCFA
jgi:hypothetical protein